VPTYTPLKIKRSGKYTVLITSVYKSLQQNSRQQKFCSYCAILGYNIAQSDCWLSTIRWNILTAYSGFLLRIFGNNLTSCMESHDCSRLRESQITQYLYLLIQFQLI